MSASWSQQCPFHADDHPRKRKAFREGWHYRHRHGPGAPRMGEVKNTEIADEALLSAWMKGFLAADAHFQDQTGGTSVSAGPL